jgi:SWI/SNF-related matrix-associated actin-dependent regulator of chromatin subfamily A member 5
MDRAHRIGQTKQVYVFRFVTENAVEEKVLERAAQKLRLDQLVIQQGRETKKSSTAASKDELVDMIQHGAEKIINASESMSVEDDIDDILRRGEEKTAKLNDKFASLNFDQLQIFNAAAAQAQTTTTWEGEEYGGRKPGSKLSNMLWIEPSKRERKTNYSVDAYYRGQLTTGSRPGQPRPRRARQLADDGFKFFPERVQELQEKERYHFKVRLDPLMPATPNTDAVSPGHTENARRAGRAPC